MSSGLPPEAVVVERLARRGGRFAAAPRAVPEETAVALTYDGSTQAVMMASPADLEDFAVGFSLTEGIVAAAADIESIAIHAAGGGIDLQMRLVAPRASALAARRRTQAGPAGCGLCGVESIEAALRPAPPVAAALAIAPAELTAAMAELGRRQTLNAETGAAHAAGLYIPGRGLVLAREDVGRHNALDKLVGALARGGERASDGVVLLTSRVSVEMVQKAAMAGAPVIAAVSAPTALAVRVADLAGITLVALLRGAEFDVFTHPGRINEETIADVA